MSDQDNIITFEGRVQNSLASKFQAMSVEEQRARIVRGGYYLEASKTFFSDDLDRLPIEYKHDEIRDFEVAMVHRLLKCNYGEPHVLLFELEKNDGRELAGRVISWRYHLRTDHNVIVEVGCTDGRTELTLAAVRLKGDPGPSRVKVKSVERFVTALLDELRRIGHQLLNVKNEFGKGSGCPFYTVNNVYLQSWKSAELLHKLAPQLEKLNNAPKSRDSI